MNTIINGHNIFLIILISFISSALLTPLVKKVAYHVNALDKPDHKRRVHKKITPRLGGLAIFGSFLIGYMLFAPKTTQMLAILIGGFIIIITGMIDDIHSIPSIPKFLCQIVAASIVVFYGNITFDDMIVFGMQFKFGLFAYPLAVLFIVAIINAINFADGLDGLASGTSTIYFVTISIIGNIINQLGGLDVILCLIMAGACLGFLIYNFAPATIFLGDSGSMFLGFIIAVVALLGFKTATITSLIIPLLILFVPIIDTALAMARRTIKGESIDTADKQHLHHQLLKRTKSTKKSVIIMYIINALFAFVSLLYTLEDKRWSIVVYLVLLVLFIILVLKTDILYSKEEITEDVSNSRKGKKK